jgi:hypothetical protein
MATGTATLDFGAFPGAWDASVPVTGQGSIAAGSLVEAWIRPADTPEHNADEHLVDPPRVAAANIVAGTGFTIYGFTDSNVRTYGRWTVAWAWT